MRCKYYVCVCVCVCVCACLCMCVYVFACMLVIVQINTTKFSTIKWTEDQPLSLVQDHGTNLDWSWSPASSAARWRTNHSYTSCYIIFITCLKYRHGKLCVVLELQHSITSKDVSHSFGVIRFKSLQWHICMCCFNGFGNYCTVCFCWHKYCCFVWKPSWKSHNFELASPKET